MRISDWSSDVCSSDLRDEGYTKLDAFTPFPLPEVTKRLGGGTWTIGWIAAVFALIGGGLTYATLFWVAAVDYPLNVGGRPLNSWADRKSVVEGKSVSVRVDLGGRRTLKKKKKK